MIYTHQHFFTVLLGDILKITKLYKLWKVNYYWFNCFYHPFVIFETFKWKLVIIPDLFINIKSKDFWYKIFQLYNHPLSMQFPSRSTIEPCCSHIDGVLACTIQGLFQKYSIHFWPGHSLSCILVTMLLPCGVVECNPNPSSSLWFGYINICLAIHKTVLIHKIVSDHSPDVLALSETRYHFEMLKTIPDVVAWNDFPCVMNSTHQR